MVARTAKDSRGGSRRWRLIASRRSRARSGVSVARPHRHKLVSGDGPVVGPFQLGGGRGRADRRQQAQLSKYGARANLTCAESRPDDRQINALARKLALHFGAGEDQALCSRAGKYCSARRIRFGRTIPSRLRRAACAESGWVTQRRRIWPCAAVGRTTSWD